jgi:multicomponent Na+:H+ antiporter subunit D
VIPPALTVAGGAVLTAVLPRGARRVAAVVVPLVALWQIATLPDGATAGVSFLTYDLELLRVDRLSRLFGGIFALIAAIAAVYAWTVDDVRQQVAALVYCAGAVGAAFAGDLLTLYVFWETMAVASTVLVWAEPGERSRRAGTRYLLVHLAGGALLLAGVVLHAQTTGSLAFRPFDPASPTPAAWLILAAFCLNAAVPPLGAWLPDAYPRATVTGAVFMSALTTKTAVYALLRGFAGFELLVVAGAVMALFGILYAMLANDIRELLAYHIVSQVGFMVAGTGIGTELAVDGAAAHAVCHILYKALLFMGAGAVITTTGRRKLTELGGFLARQRLVFVLYMVGAFSISSVPPWSGFVSKSMVIAAASAAGVDWAFLLLALASVGTFLSTSLKLPYVTWMGEDRGIVPAPAPVSMLVAMGIAAFLCTLLGVAPGLLYVHLPYPTDYQPYTAWHLIENTQVIVFTFFAFWLLLPRIAAAKATISMDTDVVYRKAAPFARAVFVDGVDRAYGAVERWAQAAAAWVRQVGRDPLRLGRDGDYDPDLRRPLLEVPATITVAVVAVMALAMLWLAAR